MNDLLVIIPCTRTTEAGTLDLYREQLTCASIPYHLLNPGPTPPLGWGIGAIFNNIFRDCLKHFSDYKKIIFSDGFDVLFYGTAEEVIRKIPNDRVLLAAERNCYPDPSIASQCIGDTPWRYANGGLTAGTPENINAWIDSIEKHPLYHPEALNQQVFNMLRAENSPLVPIDSRTELFYCAFIDEGELGAENGMPINKLCGTHPNFLHFNGGADNSGWFAAREKSLQ